MDHSREQQFDRAMLFIEDRLRDQDVSFPDRPAMAVQMIGKVSRGELSYPHTDRELVPGVYHGEELAIRVIRWYRHKYPEDLLTPGLRVETEEQFEQVMEQLDEEARTEGISIQGRPLRAHKRLSELTKTELLLTVPNREPERGRYVGDDLVIRMKRWYDERYGNRLNIVSRRGEVAFLIRGDVWSFRIPVIYGGGPKVLWICEYGAETTLPSVPQVVRPWEPVARTQYNILEAVANLSAGLAKSLTIVEREQMLRVFALGFDAFDSLDKTVPIALVDAARGDLIATVAHLTSQPAHPGQAKWSALQAAEKVLKAGISEKGGTYGRTHNLSTLAAEAATFGINVSPQWISALQTPADARYGELSVSVEDAIEAHHSSLRIALRTVTHLPQK